MFLRALKDRDGGGVSPVQSSSISASTLSASQRDSELRSGAEGQP